MREMTYLTEGVEAAMAKSVEGSNSLCYAKSPAATAFLGGEGVHN